MEEIEKGVVTLKNMNVKEQKLLSLASLVSDVKQALQSLA
jgi:histidyl-tRNA synthetase